MSEDVSETVSTLTTTEPPSCEHEQWTLGCPRCFFEACGIATDKVKFLSEEAATQHSLNGATLFGWHVVKMLSSMDIKLTHALNTTLNLTKRETTIVLQRNLRSISTYIVQTCDNRSLLVAVLNDAAMFVSEMEQVIKDNSKEEKPVKESPTGIVLTDV